MEVETSNAVLRRKLAGQNVIPVVDGFPSAMPREERDQLLELLELRCTGVGGLNAGLVVTMDEGNLVTGIKAAESTPWVDLPEVEGDAVKEFLEMFTRSYVVGKSLEDLVGDGLSITYIEPDPTCTIAIRTWSLQGVIFQNTGITEGKRDIEKGTAGLVYRVPLLCGRIDTGRVVNTYGQEWLDKMNKAGTHVNRDDATP
jgi:hypothetical protein